MRLLPIFLLAATLAVPIDREPSHRLVFENPVLKVYDVRLPPGGKSQFHAHPTAHAVVVISPARLRNEVKGKPPVDQYTGEAGKVLFLPAGPEHRQANVGRAPARWLALEFQGKPKASDILTRRVVLAPDQTATLPYDKDFLGIAITHARLEVSPGQRTKRVEVTLEAGTPTWYAKGAGMSLKNLGNEVVEMVFVKAK
jgi:quercetin dioxygenase-like cupin family protein